MSAVCAAMLWRSKYNWGKPMTALTSMSESAYADFAEQSIPAHAAEKIAAGQWSAQASIGLARQSFNDLLPQGLATPNHYFFTIKDAAQIDVGMLWMAAQDRAGQRIAYIYDISIKPQHQRKGHATRALLALEDKIRTLGLAGVALHVFGHNTGAHALYVKLGYLTTNINMFKPVKANPV